MTVPAEYTLPVSSSLPLTRLHILILLACALGFSFDLAEIAFGGMLSAVFSAPEQKVDPTMLSWLLSAVYVGAIVGTPLLGWLADQVGRRIILFSALAILTATSLGAAFAPTVPVLIVFRALSGLALGAYPPLMIAFLTDLLPPSRRGPLVIATVAIGYIGPPALIFFVGWLGPATPLGLAAWRWSFLLAGIGAAICASMFWFIPESARWLASKGRVAEAKAVLDRFSRSPTIGAIDTSQAAPDVAGTQATMPRALFIRRLAFLIAVYFLTPWAAVGFTVLSGAILVQKGINPQASIIYVGVSTFGPLIGTIFGGFLVDRVERRTALVGIAVLMGLTGFVFAIASEPLVLMGSGLIFNLLVNLLTPVLVLYAAEMFTTDRRAQGTAWGWASSRVASAIVPLALLPLLHAQGPVAMFIVVAVTLAGFAALVLLLGPRGAARNDVG